MKHFSILYQKHNNRDTLAYIVYLKPSHKPQVKQVIYLSKSGAYSVILHKILTDNLYSRPIIQFPFVSIPVLRAEVHSCETCLY